MWRVGRKVGRTLYRDEQLVGLMDTPELAAEVVEAMNEAETLTLIGTALSDLAEAGVSLPEENQRAD